MNLIFLAPPAAGKGTLSKKLEEKYGYATISAGQLLRDVDPESELGKHIRSLQAERILVGDDIIGPLMKERLEKPDIKNGFILDGFPRKMEQVDLLNEILKELDLYIDAAVYVRISFDSALKRTLGRVTCPKCKKIYNTYFEEMRPKTEGMCDECNVALETRNDDNEESLKKGFDTFERETLPVIEHYRSLGKLVEFETLDSDPEVNFKKLEEKLGLND